MSGDDFFGSFIPVLRSLADVEMLWRGRLNILCDNIASIEIEELEAKEKER